MKFNVILYSNLWRALARVMFGAACWLVVVWLGSANLAAQELAPPSVPEQSVPAAREQVNSPSISNKQEDQAAPPLASQHSESASPQDDDSEPQAPRENARLPHDLSPWKMFAAADAVVKSVMIGLILASIATWTVWFSKSIELAMAKRRLKRAFSRINATASLAKAAQQLRDVKKRRGGSCLVSSFVDVATAELYLSADIPDKSGIKERVLSRLDGLAAAAGREMNRGTGLLATIGSTAPFIGLFGTVWGIMNSFIGISETQTTNLAVVAPGIAEALLATATGLVAAIPAVITYNQFARQIAGYKAMIGDISAEVMRLVSRDLDRGLTLTLAE